MDQFDFVVVGAGSAGCVLADRLSEDGRYNVLVLEAGGSDRKFWIKVPIGYGRTFYDPAVNWQYETETDAGLNGRTSYWPRGKVLGGSSSINAMVYVRGLPGDYQDWRDLGNIGWGWDDVLPAFKRSECFIGRDGQRRGTGKLHVTDPYNDMHPLKHFYMRAAQEMSLPICEDMNGEDPEGAGFFQITTQNGFRCSSADAFLRPALKRQNVQLITGATVSRVLFEGKRATGVTYRKNGRLCRVLAQKEVILSGGSINTPKILQLSGIGPGALLQQHGINIVHEKSAVGRNLQDHLGINYYYKSRVPTLNDELYPWWGKLWAGMKYVLLRKGPLSLSVNQGGGFVKTRPDLARANVQLYFNPVTYTTAPAGTRPLMNPDPYSGFIIAHQPCRPTSRGYLEIRSRDPEDAPVIHPNYLSTNEDIENVIEGGHLIRELMNTPSIRDLVTEVIEPDLRKMSDAEIVEDFRQRGGSNFHPVSTCMMGPDEKTAVVDNRLKVYGVEGLRVVDASVFPTVTSGNTNAPSIMVGQRGADFILSDA
ncbi:GMC family oxidoreductase N-terminal domain-containing protein [Kiloniella laminariae]|uniref:GMC family oxidoreductase N-terminal domain-containing protein n=1 Tax=Kiloniella laminariae TaxID=454162 RepID=A0ABT4LLN0_9PROT|nr:GMC family oxidoreductase N-terminal domain-containing protein [Kiloniella laminariae]MCZ4280872.1 GMC family oxidoreductase N-terminal domain-containing protein [Kiloniella laminariae]